MNKAAIKNLQYRLRKVLKISLSIDGNYGPSTTRAVEQFQIYQGLWVDGIAGAKTLARLHLVYIKTFQQNSNLLHFGQRRFVIFVDAGHGGIDENGRYVTSGKRAYHKDLILHERGHYYEGFENRLTAEAFIEACTKKGIQCIRTYHPHKDWSLWLQLYVYDFDWFENGESNDKRDNTKDYHYYLPTEKCLKESSKMDWY